MRFATRKNMKQPEDTHIRELRKRLLNWHYSKTKTITIFDLLTSDYQRFRIKVSHRIGKDLDFREAIKQANEDELHMLEQIRDELRLGI